MYVPGASTPEFFQLRPDIVTSASYGRIPRRNLFSGRGAT